MWFVFFIVGTVVLLSCAVLGSATYLEQKALLTDGAAQRIVPLPVPRPIVKTVMAKEEVELVRAPKLKPPTRPKARRR
jgi:hypothetical protein